MHFRVEVLVTWLHSSLTVRAVRAKVGADEKAHWQKSQYLDEIGEPYGEKISIGVCPQCTEILVGRAEQIQFKGWEGAEDDLWSDFRPHLSKAAKAVFERPNSKGLDSLVDEEDLRSMQAGAPTAACVMFGRALEALCRDMLKTTATAGGFKERTACHPRCWYSTASRQQDY